MPPLTFSFAARYLTAPRTSFSVSAMFIAIIFCSASLGCSVVSPL